jgi:hypothetical protein
MWDFRWTKWHWDRFFPKYFGFPPVLHYTEKWKKLIIIFVFITGLHKKP